MTAPIRLVAISDTHNHHHQITVPDGDILVHAGDFCGRGVLEEAQDFADWFASQPHPHKVVIAGNHDFCVEIDPVHADRLFSDPQVTYLMDQSVTVAGLRFHGAPWQPWFHDWAFNLPRGPELAAKWALIGDDVDVLLTHGPPQGILDRTFSGLAVGCADLTEALARVRPRVHVFGHIHEAYGTQEVDGTLHVNACSCTLRYEPLHPPVVVDISDDGCVVV